MGMGTMTHDKRELHDLTYYSVRRESERDAVKKVNSGNERYVANTFHAEISST